MAERHPTMRLSRTCAASPEAVFETITDLRSHLAWAGSEQRRGFRLLSLDDPAGPARPGTVFTTTGSIPMTRRRWHDRSTVTAATAPSTFELVTDGEVGGGRRTMTARYRHRYDIEPAAGGGSMVTYTLTQEAIANPMARLALPVIRRMTWRVGLPMLAGRGVRNLLRQAETAGAAGAAGAAARGAIS